MQRTEMVALTIVTGLPTVPGQDLKPWPLSLRVNRMSESDIELIVIWFSLICCIMLDRICHPNRVSDTQHAYKQYNYTLD